VIEVERSATAAAGAAGGRPPLLYRRGGAGVFYGDVFGWDARVVSDTPEFRLTVLTDGDETIAGIMDASAFLPADEPSQWKVYIKVTDTDAALARAVGLGGTVVSAAMDTPYGRLAEVADPTGARFKLIG